MTTQGKTGTLGGLLPQNGGMARLVGRLPQWVSRYRARRALSALDDYLLSDIGLTRDDATREATRPFWQE